jgi:phosphatidylglycerol:prolipoprotein diacylglycerol transferase
MTFWNHIYEHFDPIAFSIGVNVHWYGIMYVLALVSALVMAKWIVTKDKLPIDKKVLDDYFIWIEVGVILGARLGYILFYDPHTAYYLTHPWQIFNPFNTNGEFVGIRGMSYHGALIGFLLGSYLFARKNNYSFWFLMDIVAIAVPVGYIFGRIGNFLNQELIGRTTDVPWGIYVDGVLRHPSQLYEAFLEGIVVALIIYLIRHRISFAGGLTLVYGALYGLARFVAEFWRAPDVQIGYVFGDWMTQGQLLSLPMIIISVVGIYYLKEAKFPRELNRKS